MFHIYEWGPASHGELVATVASSREAATIAASITGGGSTAQIVADHWVGYVCTWGDVAAGATGLKFAGDIPADATEVAIQIEGMLGVALDSKHVALRRGRDI